MSFQFTPRERGSQSLADIGFNPKSAAEKIANQMELTNLASGLANRDTGLASIRKIEAQVRKQAKEAGFKINASHVKASTLGLLPSNEHAIFGDILTSTVSGLLGADISAEEAGQVYAELAVMTNRAKNADKYGIMPVAVESTDSETLEEVITQTVEANS